MAVDDGMRKLHIPQTFTPYVEQYGIYDLFYDITVAYALNQPDDHVIFLRNYLCKLDEISDCMKIIILGSPHIDKRGLAEEIATGLNLLMISFKDIKDRDDSQGYTPKTCAINLKNIIDENLKGKCGWILYDYPRGRDEARQMTKYGIYPTHTYQLIPSPEYYTKRDLWNESLIGKNPKEFKEMIDCYKRRLLELRETYSDTLKEIIIRGRTLQQIARAIVINTKQLISKGGPQLPRVVIVGDLTKKVENALKQLCAQLKLIFVDMEEVVCEGTKKDDELGKHIRLLEKRKVPIYGRLVIALIQNRLMCYDCLNEGWILIRFPRDRADFEALDTFDTPPNRIIFLIPTDLDKRECLRDWVALNPRNYAQEIKDALCTTPKESEKFTTTPLTVKQMRDFLDYCGKHCKFVNSELSFENLIEVIWKYITDSPLCAEPRSPATKEELFEQLLTEPQINQEESAECCFQDERLLHKDEEKLEEIKKLEESSFESVMEQFSDSTTKASCQVKSSSVLCEDKSCLDIFPWKNEYQGCGVRTKRKDPHIGRKQAPSSSEFDLQTSSSFR